jgi:hypothetical protein
MDAPFDAYPFSFRSGVRRSGALLQVRIDGVRSHHPWAGFDPSPPEWAEAVRQGGSWFSFVLKRCASHIQMFDLLTDSHGYVARDDTRKEIVVAFRGS